MTTTNNENTWSPDLLIGDSPESRLNIAVGQVYADLVATSFRAGELPEVTLSDENKVFQGSKRTAGGVRSISYVMRDGADSSSVDEFTPRIIADNSIEGGIRVAATNSFVRQDDGVFTPSCGSVVTETDLLRTIGGSTLRNRTDLGSRKYGLSSEDFGETLQRATKELDLLSEGAEVSLGVLNTTKLTVHVTEEEIGSPDFSTRKTIDFTDAEGVKRLSVKLYKDAETVNAVVITESDEFLEETNQYTGKKSVHYRGGSAIDNLAAKVVSKLADKKEEEPKPPRRSLRERFKDAFKTTPGSIIPFSGDGNKWTNEQLVGENQAGKVIRETQALIGSIHSRQEVRTSLERIGIAFIDLPGGDFVAAELVEMDDIFSVKVEAQTLEHEDDETGETILIGKGTHSPAGNPGVEFVVLKTTDQNGSEESEVYVKPVGGSRGSGERFSRIEKGGLDANGRVVQAEYVGGRGFATKVTGFFRKLFGKN